MGNHKLELNYQIRSDPAREIDPNQEEQAGLNYQDLEYFYFHYDEFYEEEQNYLVNIYRNYSHTIDYEEYNRISTGYFFQSWTWPEIRFLRSENYGLQYSTNYHSNFMQIPIPLIGKWERSFTNYLLSVGWPYLHLTIEEHYRVFVQKYPEIMDPNKQEKLNPIKQIFSRENSFKSLKRLNRIAFTRNKTAQRIFAY